MKIEYNNATKLLAVIGDPIGHSLSPLLQNTMIRELGLDYLYLCMHITADSLPQWLDTVRLTGICGFNATMPHKELLLPMMDELTEEARMYGAVNTVRQQDGRFYGHNTDGRGFSRMLADHEIGFAGKKITILGAGGSARSIALRAVLEKAQSVSVLNRTAARAETLCALAPQTMHPVTRIPADTELLISTLPIGAQGSFDMAQLDALSPSCDMVDILYAPWVTPLMQAAEARGMRTANGLGMLIYQGIYALEFFTGVSIDDTEMGKLLYRTARENL